MFNHLAGIFSMMILGLTMPWRAMGGQVASYTESFMVMFTVLGFYFLFRAFQSNKLRTHLLDLFIAGLMLGISISFKQVALFSIIAGMVILLKTDSPFKTTKMDFIRNGAVLVCGILMSTFLILIPLFLNHVSLKFFWNEAWLILLQKGSSPSTLLPRAEGFITIFKQSPIILFYPLLFLFFIQKKEITSRNIPYSFALIWMLFDFIGVNSSGIYYSHQIKQLIPSLALVSGMALTTIIETKISNADKKQKWTVNILVMIILLWLPHSSAMGIEELIYPPQNTNSQLGNYIKENTRPDDYIYVVGGSEPEILINSERRSASRYINQIFLGKHGAMEELSSDLKMNPPRWILIHNNTDQIMHPVASLIYQSYEYRSTEYEYRIFEKI
jgi:hypothetical protein